MVKLSMGTATQSRKIVNSNCILYDWCSGLVLRPLRSACFESLGTIEEYHASIDAALISVRQAASNCDLKPKTLYNWIESGKLRQEHGLRPWGKRWRIEWPVLKACIDRGEFASCS